MLSSNCVRFYQWVPAHFRTVQWRPEKAEDLKQLFSGLDVKRTGGWGGPLALLDWKQEPVRPGWDPHANTAFFAPESQPRGGRDCFLSCSWLGCRYENSRCVVGVQDFESDLELSPTLVWHAASSWDKLFKCHFLQAFPNALY